MFSARTEPRMASRRMMPKPLICCLLLLAMQLTASASEMVRAQLTPRRQAVLSAEIAARVQKLHVTEGQSFAADAPLVSFDAALPRAQLARARAVLEAAERTLATSQRLLKLNSAGEIEVDLAATEVRKAKADVDYAQTLLERCEIHAPFAGRVADQHVFQEEFVTTGQALIAIIDDQSPRIDFIAPSKWLAWIQPGQLFHIHIDETGRDYEAVIETIGARVDPVSQSVKVIAGLTGKHPELVVGMSGSVDITPPPSRMAAR